LQILKLLQKQLKIRKIQQNQRKIVRFGGYCIPLAARKKPAAQGLADAAGSGLVAICRKRDFGGAKKG